MTVDIESRFLQFKVNEQDKSWLTFLLIKNLLYLCNYMSICASFLAAKISPICASYTFKRVGFDKEEEFPIAAKAVHNDFFTDDLFKSIDWKKLSNCSSNSNLFSQNMSLS